ncbi:Uncharacterised protein [Mycobacterium tuberculosis]|uniref:Uncharacterized protein n=1 Tax=Mycobacterium tuberculosis TaxID=1773 RepID=A0A0U0TBW6_MYCTX|nr:Uncharacterised protein [Mycobacterium tuberculosis]COX40781.1 Uncharacterised protein [Mycobacterium tuberculosis]COX43390.1 Uncharacterised protein [Mycobacterium tuberculosis]
MVASRCSPRQYRSNKSSAVRPWFTANRDRSLRRSLASLRLSWAALRQYVTPAIGASGRAGHHAPTKSADHRPGGRSPATADGLHARILGIDIIGC